MLARRKSRKSSLFFKYLLSYMLILCIPLVFTGVFIFGYFSDILEKEITDGNLAMLTHINSVVDNQVLEFNKISSQIFNNYRLKPYSLNKNTTAKIDAINELNNYRTGNDFIYNLALYVKDTDFIISASGTYDAPNFINAVYDYDQWKYNDFMKDVNDLSKPSFRYSEDVFLAGANCTESFITYMVPSDQSTAIFMVNENKFKNLISVKSESGCENTVIVDKDANIVTSMKDWPYLHSEPFFDLIRYIDDKGTGIAEIQKTAYFYSYVKSEITGWIYVTMIPEREALKSVFNVRQKAFYGWIIIILLGSCFIYYVTYYNYNPIRKLGRLAEEKWGQQIAGHNEFEVVESVINRMADNGIALKESLNNSKTAVKESLLLELLKGQIDSFERFNVLGKDIGMHFSKPFYTVCIIHSKLLNDMKSTQKMSIIQEVENSLQDCAEGYGRDGTAEGTLIFILSMQKNDAPSLKNVLQNIKGKLCSLYKLNISVGVGNSCSLTSQIGRSYLEAVTAIDYKFIFGENKIIFFNEIVINGTNNIIYPEKELKDMQLFIRQGSIDCIEDTLKAIVECIKDSDMTMVIARCICFDIINSVLKAVNEIGISTMLSEKEYFNIEDLNHFNTPEELTDIIMRICTDLCHDIRESKESRNFTLKDKLIQYIDENCDGQNFCVKSMADAFGLSQSYLSRFFKDQTGQTLSEYQMFLRMKKAKHYLKSTNEPLKNIVNMIGYCNEASFVRLFKKMEGITPGEFRKLSQNANHHSMGLIS